MKDVRYIVGVDFSGGRAATRNVWIARLRPTSARAVLEELAPLAKFAGNEATRDEALAALVSLIRSADKTVFGIDFPFGLPIELAAMGSTWKKQLDFICKFAGGAKEFGTWCVAQAKSLGGPMHIRRTTDGETRTPFDCYHYRIVYQTFHGMRDVLCALAKDKSTAILPFQYERFHDARRVVMEACPSSTLKRLRLPHQNYKEPTAKTASRAKRRVRGAILAVLDLLVEMSAKQRETLLSNPGGDALDAVIAAVGTMQSLASVDHAAIQRHLRYSREGFIYA